MQEAKVITMLHIQKEWAKRKEKLGVNKLTGREYTWAELAIRGILATEKEPSE
jgi:hypothetical protein